MDLQKFEAGNNAPMIISLLQPEVHTLCQLPATCGPLRQEHGPLQAVWRANPQERVRGPHGGLSNDQGGVCLWEDDWEMQVRNSQGQIKNTLYCSIISLYSSRLKSAPKGPLCASGALLMLRWEIWRSTRIIVEAELRNVKSVGSSLCSRTLKLICRQTVLLNHLGRESPQLLVLLQAILRTLLP